MKSAAIKKEVLRRYNDQRRAINQTPAYELSRQVQIVIEVLCEEFTRDLKRAEQSHLIHYHD